MQWRPSRWILVTGIGRASDEDRGVIVPWSVGWPPPSGKRTESAHSMSHVSCSDPAVVTGVLLFLDIPFGVPFEGAYLTQDMTVVSSAFKFELFWQANAPTTAPCGLVTSVITLKSSRINCTALRTIKKRRLRSSCCCQSSTFGLAAPLVYW